MPNKEFWGSNSFWDASESHIIMSWISGSVNLISAYSVHRNCLNRGRNVTKEERNEFSTPTSELCFSIKNSLDLCFSGHLMKREPGWELKVSLGSAVLSRPRKVFWEPCVSNYALWSENGCWLQKAVVWEARMPWIHLISGERKASLWCTWTAVSGTAILLLLL